MPPRPRGLAKRPALLPALALSAAALFWSGNFVVGRAVRADVDPVTLNTLRWGLCLVMLLPLAGRRVVARRDLLRRDWRLLLALGATGMAGFQTFVYLAVARTTAVNALLMLAAAPAAIMAAAALTGDSRPGALQWLGCLVSFAGAAILVTQGDLAALLALRLNPGDLWMLGAIGCWAAYSLLLRRRPADIDPATALAGSILGGLAILVPLAAAQLTPIRLVLSPGMVAALLYVALFASLGAFLLWSYGVDALGAARAGQFLYLMPVFGSALAVGLLGESIGAAQLAGAGLVFAGILLVNRPRSPRTRR
jgi:drug/metabolite transporter (DMT)-like permease